MKVLFVHPGPLLFTSLFLRLEPLGLALVAEVARRAGHEIRIVDLQVETHADYHRMIAEWSPDVVAFSGNYLANVPEIVNLAKATKIALPRCFICVGGHSASFTAVSILEHGAGAIDCVLKGEGEAGIVNLLDAVGDRGALAKVAGAATLDGEGPKPGFVAHPDAVRPARDLLRHRNKYFVGMLDPCASIEFSRGCPWDCSFCSAWTFYGRSYRTFNPDRVAEDLATIREPGVLIVDDVAFIQAKHGFAVGEAIERKGIRKEFFLETRGDVLLRNKEVFQYWKKLGLSYLFLGMDAIDEDGLKKFRKRIPLGRNFEALEFARSLGIEVVINIISDPDWDEERFRVLREWCLEVPEIVDVTVNTPYPGTESWLTEKRELQTRDYRLFDIKHAVLPTRLPLAKFYQELLDTQRVLLHKRLSPRLLPRSIRPLARNLLRGQLNLLLGIINNFRTVNLERMLTDHANPVSYEMALPPKPSRGATSGPANQLYVHAQRGRADRHIDETTERFFAAG